MTYWGLELGVQSYCFRKFGNEDIVQQLKDCGLNQLEICGVHIDVNDAAKQDEVVALYRENGISFNSFGINTITDDETAMRNLFEIAKKLGITTMGINPKPGSYELLNRLLEEYDMKAAIHNHGKKDQQHGKSEQLEQVLSQLSNRVGLCVDTGWFIDSEEDPAAVIRKFADRVYGVHLKDFDYTADGERQEKVLGTGKLDLKDVLKALQEVGFSGTLTLEYEGDPDDPVPSIRACVDNLNEAYQSIRA